MADAYSYALLVELEETNAPKLKNKLVKYFQSKKSNGGDCEVDHDSGDRTAVVRFRREEDQQNVLAKEGHQMNLAKGVLKMTVRPLEDETQEAPPDKINKESVDDNVSNKPSIQEEVGSTSAVLGNIPESLSQEFLEMLVENVLKDLDSPSAAQSFTLEVIPGMSSAVVTLQSEKEITDFVTRCPQNRTFTKKGLSVKPLEVTEQVVVEDLHNFNEDLLRLYFDNEGVDVENVVLNEAEQSAIITFKDHKAVQKILKKKHHIKDKEIKVYTFYKSLGTALYGKDKPSLKLPAAISEPIDDAVWRYLNNNRSAAETIRAQLANHFCNVNLNQSTVCLSPVSSLLQQKDANTIVKEWKDTVKSAFGQALSRFKSLKLQPESESWEESEKKIRQMLLNEDVLVVPNKAKGALSVVGLVADVHRLEKPLSEAIKKIVASVQREKLSVTQEIKMSPSIFHILCQDGLQEKLLSVYPELSMSFRQNSPDLRVTGLQEEIMAARKVIYDEMFSLKRQNLEMDTFLLDLMKGEQQEELTKTLLISNGINAALDISADRVQLLAVSNRDMNNAEDHLRKLLISQYIDVEDVSVLGKAEWKHLVSQLENANNKPCRRIKIHTTGQKVVVSGHKDDVTGVSSELDDFLTQNAQVEEAVVVKPNIKVDYIKKHGTSWLQQVDDKVVVSYRKEAICLNGSRADVTERKGLVEDVVSSVVFESLKISMPGVKKFFKDQEAMYVSSLLNETGCLVQLVEETNGGQDDSAHRLGPTPVYQLQTSEGVELAVSKADICTYPVHAVVNSSNHLLKHDGGLSEALLIAAGPQLQDECDKIINLNGQLKPGDSVITGAGGQLCCRKVIHAVAPVFEADKPQKSLLRLKKAVKGSLELAEKHGCVTVALPTISRNLGFHLDVCAGTIIKAVSEYCDEKFDDNTLKKIHFVDNNDIALQAMVAALRKEYGHQGQGVSHSQQTLTTKSTKSAVSDPNCLGQAQTKEGLGIILMKGNIENATTKVTVNAVFEHLDLRRGAISNAIIGAAGSKLQKLVKAKKATGCVGEVIVTDGCNLKSKQVFHAVSPQWDNGQGAAEKALSGIFNDCLNMAEDSGQTSISFPAIGTGHLGFPKDLVASLMLDNIVAFSSTKKHKHLKKVVIILYPGDTQTIQVFSDEFKKKFQNALGVPVPTNSGLFSKIVSSSAMHETRLGSVAVQVLTGDITKETTDVIVNSSNDTFSLKSGVSKAILDAAGPTVESECALLGSQPNPGFIMTNPGNLSCKKILHIVGQTDLVEINKSVKNALQTCVTNSYTSVSFPAIGTGQGNVNARKVADTMLDAVIDVLGQNTSSTLNTVRIVIFQPPMLKEFYNSMQQREASDPNVKAGSWLGNLVCKIRAFFPGGPDQPQKDEDFVIEALEVDPAYFHICGASQAGVDSAKQRIQNLISKEHDTYCISECAILSLSDADYRRISDIQKTLNVSIRIESKNTKASINIEGLSKDVLKASMEINGMLRKVREEEELEKKVALAGTLVDWQYQLFGLQFQSFHPRINYELEQALENGVQSVKVTIQSQNHTVHMPAGPAIDNQGRTIEIKRIDKLIVEDVPSSWDPMPANTTSLAVTLQAGSAEYAEVQNMFSASCGQPITKIERIQNPILWKSLQIKKRDMEQRNGHQNNERRLFHGTCHSTVVCVNEHGFNRSYAGKNAANYGNGTYFAVNANYSAQDTYSIPNASGEKCMYLCRVLTGDFTMGQRNMIVPPAKGATLAQKYDSVVDNLQAPNMFVIFHDSQAYPEYLISF